MDCPSENRLRQTAGNSTVFERVETDEIINAARIEQFNGLWCVPGSPYHSMEGALRAIRYAREQRVPLLATCGGFQHVVIEYARNVLHWTDAEHAETSPNASRAVIAPLFQPERAALEARRAPLVEAFVKACTDRPATAYHTPA